VSGSRRSGDELVLSLETVAACYRVELTVLRQACELGLFGEPRGAELGIAASRLDRVAEIVRLHVHHGIELSTLFLLLDPEA